MNVRLIISVIILVLISSCNQGPKGPIELNNGKKWKLNAEMMPPLRSSEFSFSLFKGTDLQSYKTLASELGAKNKVLIASCTMEGKGHNELHKWLHLYTNLISDLETVDNVENAEVIIEKMKKSFSTFNQNFE